MKIIGWIIVGAIGGFIVCLLIFFNAVNQSGKNVAERITSQARNEAAALIRAQDAIKEAAKIGNSSLRLKAYDEAVVALGVLVRTHENVGKWTYNKITSPLTDAVITKATLDSDTRGDLDENSHRNLMAREIKYSPSGRVIFYNTEQAGALYYQIEGKREFLALKSRALELVAKGDLSEEIFKKGNAEGVGLFRHTRNGPIVLEKINVTVRIDSGVPIDIILVSDEKGGWEFSGDNQYIFMEQLKKSKSFLVYYKRKYYDLPHEADSITLLFSPDGMSLLAE